jgi:phage tail sheath protein FI
MNKKKSLTGASTGRLSAPPGLRATTLLQVQQAPDTEPAGYVLSWQAKRSSGPSAQTDAQLQLALAWGTEQGAFEAVVDARRGGRVWLPASTITVEVQYPGTTGPTYDVRGAVTWGSADTPRPTLTQTIGPVAAGGVITANLPDFADALIVYPSNLSALGGTSYGGLEFARGGEGTGEYAAAMAASFGQVYAAFTIPNGADGIKLTNNSGAPLAWVCVYTLAL